MKTIKMPTLQRWILHVDMSRPAGCWLWTAHRTRDGYGKFQVSYGNGIKSLMSAHRIGYEMLVGPIPQGLHLDHLCRNPPCVNPAHLGPVTQWENTRRGISPVARHAAATHCPQGHEYNAENVYTPPGTRHRLCRVCRSARPR